MNEFSNYFDEYIHLLIPLDPDLEVWSALFDQARTNWDFPLAQRLLHEAKQHELSGYTQALVHQADGLFALQYGDLSRAIKCLQTSLHYFEELRKNQDILFTYSQLGMLYRVQGELNTAVDYHSHQLVLADQLGVPEWQVSAHKELGFDYYELGELSHAARILDKGLILANASEDLAELHNTIGLVAWQDGDLPKAATHFNEALQRFQELELAHPVAQATANLGNVAYASGDIQQAIEYYTLALEIFNEIGVVFDKIGLLNNLGGIAIQRDDYENAYTYFQESFNLAIEVGDQIGEQNALINLGVTAMKQGNYLLALENYHKAVSMSKDIGNRSTTRQVYRKLARLELLLGIETLRKSLNGDRTATWGETTKHFLKSASHLLQSFFMSVK